MSAGAGAGHQGSRGSLRARAVAEQAHVVGPGGAQPAEGHARRRGEAVADQRHEGEVFFHGHSLFAQLIEELAVIRHPRPTGAERGAVDPRDHQRDFPVAMTVDGTALGAGAPPVAHNRELLDQLREVADVTVEEDLTLVALIGNRLTTTPGVALRGLRAAGPDNVRLLCHGASPQTPLLPWVAGACAENIARPHARRVPRGGSSLKKVALFGAGRTGRYVAELVNVAGPFTRSNLASVADLRECEAAILFVPGGAIPGLLPLLLEAASR